MLGSFISGFVSFFFGYYVTFFLAAFCLAVGALFTSTLSAGVEGEITSS
jgi:ABC-type Co2+ transport system permease subunit